MGVDIDAELQQQMEALSFVYNVYNTVRSASKMFVWKGGGGRSDGGEETGVYRRLNDWQREKLENVITCYTRHRTRYLANVAAHRALVNSLTVTAAVPTPS